MTDNKKIYKQPVYRIIQIRSKLSLLDGSSGATEDPDARQNDMEDMDDY